MLPDGLTAKVRATDGGAETLYGHFARFDQFTESNSIIEGNFLERIQRGAFAKTFSEGRDRMKVLFQHGRDAQIGDKPLGRITDLREDTIGAAYSVAVLDTDYVRELVPGLQAGLYGASFRFRPIREELIARPRQSLDNPKGLPETTLLEVQVREFGPVTFPAYEGTSAAVRSTSAAPLPQRAAGLFEESGFPRRHGPLSRLLSAEKQSVEATRALLALERGERIRTPGGTSDPLEVKRWEISGSRLATARNTRPARSARSSLTRLPSATRLP